MQKEQLNPEILEFLKKLKATEFKAIIEPISDQEFTFSTPINLEEEEISEDDNGNEKKSITNVTAMLHGRIKRTCYYVYAKYQYEAWVTLNNKPYVVDVIKAKMNSGIQDFTKTVKNTHTLKKLDEVYETGNACRSSRMTATAKKGNASGTVEIRL